MDTIENEAFSCCIPVLHIFRTASNLLPPVNTHRLNHVCKCYCWLWVLALLFETRQLTRLVQSGVALFLWHWQSTPPHFHAGINRIAMQCRLKFRLTCERADLMDTWCFLNIYWNASILYQKSDGFNLYTLFDGEMGGLWCNCCLIELVSFSWQDTLFKLGSAYKPFSDPFV